MKAPEGHPSYGNSYWKLNKALYGLKQAGREWNKKLNDELIKLKFRRLISEPCIYIKESEERKISCILAVYVDDILIAGNENDINSNKNLIKNIFNIKDIGEVDFVIGIKFERYDWGLFIHQRGYIMELLEKYNLDKSPPVKTPRPIEDKLLKRESFDGTKYRSAIGNLLYLAICTRPDILLSVSRAARKNQNPTMEDWENVMRILKYLKGTINYGIKFTKSNSLKVFVDADYAGDLETRKSTTGFLFVIGDSPVSWYSKLQHCVATSTAEAEYYSLSECGKHALWCKNLLNELNVKIECINISIDNKAAIYNGLNQSINKRSKHIDIRFHHIRDLINKGIIKLSYIKSNENLADGFTKYLNGPLMTKFRNDILYNLDK